MSIDKKALYTLGYGLYVVTARDEKDNGCICNTVMQLTDTPLQVAVSLNKSNFTFEQIRKTGMLNVNVLSESTPFDVFRHFGFQSGRDADKFADFDLWRTENGVAALTGEYSNAVLSLKVTETVDLGSHALFICRVTEAHTLMERPNMSYAYYHANVKPKPEAKQSGWVCKICGYKYEGDPLPEDFICPWCKHPASDFEKI